MKTLKNKLYAIALVLFGMIAVPLFFAKENWIC